VDVALNMRSRCSKSARGRPAIVEGQGNPDGWWGDRYWRTARNTSVWDDAKRWQ